MIWVKREVGLVRLGSKFPGDVPCAKIRTVGEIIQEPHVQSSKILEEVDYPTMGKIKTVKTPAFFFGQPPATRLQAPFLGELGYSQEAIDDLIAKKIVLDYKS
jgi:crotonobetainyl-CoA:carnitine CoA-transferase CaiB-like acyl-CoA transferase